MKPITTLDSVGAVVIGRNEGERLIKCLSSLRASVSTIVYVDSGSSDRSVEAAKELGAVVFLLARSSPFTAARARNAGAAELKKLKPDLRFVQFVDGDCEVIPGWLEAGVKFLNRREDVAIVCGRRRERYPMASMYNTLCDLEWDTAVGPTTACGGDSLVRLTAFESVGGFGANLIAGEEPELCLRLREVGWKIWRLDAEMTLHDAAMTRFRQWWLRTARGGYAFAEVTLLYWKSPASIWNKEFARAVFWGVLLPFSIGTGSLLYPPILVACLVYPLQIARIAAGRELRSKHSWSYALFMTLGKFAEAQGIITFFWRRFCKGPIKLIEYK